MLCPLVRRDLDAFRDRELSAATAAAIRAHVDACRQCRRLLAERDGLGRIVKAAPIAAAPARLRARVIARIRSAEQP